MPAARLPHRHRRHCRRSIAVRVEEGLGDLKRAPLIVMSKDLVVLHSTREKLVCRAACLRCGGKLMQKPELEMC